MDQISDGPCLLTYPIQHAYFPEPFSPTIFYGIPAITTLVSVGSCFLQVSKSYLAANLPISLLRTVLPSK